MEPQPVQYTTVHVHAAPSNGLGTAGFVLSLIGFLTCGFLSPIGFILSLVGLLKSPRGLAIAGSVLGFIGSIWLWLAGAAMVLGFVGLTGATNAAMEAARKAQENERARVAAEAARQPAETEPIATDAIPDAALATDPPAAEVADDAAVDEMEAGPAQTEAEPAIDESPEVETPSPADDPDYRTWTATGGKTLEATFVSAGAGKVKLRKSDGSVISVDIDKLSDADRDWIKSRGRR